MKLRVAHVTTCRSDYGPCYWLLREMFSNKHLEATLLVAGSHLNLRRGNTVSEIDQHKWPRVHRLPFLSGKDTAEDLSVSCSRALKVFGDYFARAKPDMLSLYGDRIELLPIATAAVIHGIPIAHICGGDVTEGAIDDQVRHALTKMAHLHFPSTKLSAGRIRRMGEERWRIHCTGDPALDCFRTSKRASKQELETYLGLPLVKGSLLVTLHPETIAPEVNALMVEELIAALDDYTASIVVTAPAPDPGAQTIRKKLQKFSKCKPNVVFVESLGSYLYRSLLNHVSCVVGNSSSGLIEAAAVPVPAINIGERQKGRQRGSNVIDVKPRRDSIVRALRIASSSSFRKKLSRLKNPYGAGDASQRIVRKLVAEGRSCKILRKRFE